MTVHVELLRRQGCHLCDDAEVTVSRVVDQASADGLSVSVHTTDIDDHPELITAYSEEVPVVFINGRQHTYWKVDDQRLAQCLRSACAKDAAPRASAANG